MNVLPSNNPQRVYNSRYPENKAEQNIDYQIFSCSGFHKDCQRRQQKRYYYQDQFVIHSSSPEINAYIVCETYRAPQLEL